MLTKHTQVIILSWQEVEEKILYLAERIKSTTKQPITIQPLSKDCIIAAHILAEFVDGTVAPLGNITFDLTDAERPDYALFEIDKEGVESKKETYTTDVLFKQNGIVQRVKFTWKKL